MFVIMGATGHVGSAAAEALLARGEPVTVVLHDPCRAGIWQERGAKSAVADVEDVDALRAVLRLGRRAFLLNPPADTHTDTDAVERRTAARLLAALDGSGLEKVVAASTAGAQPGERLGDLSVLWEFERGLERQPIPAAINRGAYYMSNWDALVGEVRQTGRLPTMFPANLALPMVAPQDLGHAAAQRLLSPVDDAGTRQVEGPARYSPAEVAAAFAQALGRPVEVAVTPRDQWQAAYRRLGFSDAAAEAYTRMTAAIVDKGFASPDSSLRGATTLDAYIRALVGRG